MAEPEVHISEEAASGGSKEGVVRYVLIIGTLLTVVALTLIWVTGALSQGDVEEEATVSGMIQSQEDGQPTDTIVGGAADDFSSEEPVTDVDDGLSVVENEAAPENAQ